jgi:hypothetical protein
MEYNVALNYTSSRRSATASKFYDETPPDLSEDEDDFDNDNWDLRYEDDMKIEINTPVKPKRRRTSKACAEHRRKHQKCPPQCPFRKKPGIYITSSFLMDL